GKSAATRLGCSNANGSIRSPPRLNSLPTFSPRPTPPASTKPAFASPLPKCSTNSCCSMPLTRPRTAQQITPKTLRASSMPSPPCAASAIGSSAIGNSWHSPAAPEQREGAPVLSRAPDEGGSVQSVPPSTPDTRHSPDPASSIQYPTHPSSNPPIHQSINPP